MTLDLNIYSRVYYLSPANRDEAEDIASLLRQLKPEGADDFRTRHLEAQEVRHAAASSAAWIAVVHELNSQKIVGVGSLCLLTTLRGRGGFIEDLVVDPSHRRRGIGRALMDELLDKADRVEKLPETKLTLYARQTAARALCERLGFVEVTKVQIYSTRLPHQDVPRSNQEMGIGTVGPMTSLFVRHRPILGALREEAKTSVEA